jgi:Mg-chelatase subunit ChlD
MNPFLAFVTAHWFAVLLLLLALIPGVFAVRSQLRGALSLAALLPAAGLALAGVGGLVLDPEWGAWIAAAAAAAFFVMFLVLIFTSAWLRPLAYAVASLLAVGLGGLVTLPASERLLDAGRALASLEPAQPWWLLLLLLVPLVFWFSYRSLAGLGPVRRWVALGLRCLLIGLLALALSELRIKHQNDTVTVLFLVDRSLSVPEELGPSSTDKSKIIDRRWERVKEFINTAVEKRGSGHERDKAGLIAFGRRPRLELPPSDAPRFKFQEFASTIDGNYTDIAAAIKLALASFPEGSGKRIILLSDGNENMGNAEEQARIAKQNGVQIDVVPLGAGQRNENEVLVERVEAPPVAEQGSRLPIRVLLRNHNPNPVIGELTLRQIVEGVARPVGEPKKVTLAPGLSTFKFEQPHLDASKTESYTYEAEFVPEGVVVNAEKGVVERLVGDRVQNNKATTHVVARGRRRILLLETARGQHTYFVREMRARKLDITTLRIEELPKDKDKLTILLSNFDCVILANVPADSPDNDKPEFALDEDQQEALRSNTHEQGCGLVVIGGPDSYGAGGWQNTPIEKALPVESEIKALKMQGKGGLVLIMHASEMANGNYWQKQIAKLAIDKLSNVDEVGILHYDWGVMKWHIPLQEIGEKREFLKKQVDKLVPGDMPDFDPGLKMAHEALTDPARELSVRHVIVISDGDPMQNNQQLLRDMRRDKVTVSTVGVATHGAAQDQHMAQIASTTGGRYHKVKSANMLPAVYIKETRLVSQSFIYEKRFTPRALPLPGGPTENLAAVPDLYGFVRTTPKESPLVGIPIKSPDLNGQDFPILAYWQYGLGRSVAFTSDARSNPLKQVKGWDRDWAGSDMYVKFWEQVINWALRPSESRTFAISLELRDGKIKVIVDARDENNNALLNLDLRGKVTTPSGKAEAENRADLEFKPTNAGVYEAEFKADETGSYFINVQSFGAVLDKNGKPIVKDGQVVKEAKDGVRAGVTVPYSPEYADLETNTALLEKLRVLTDGEIYTDSDAALPKVAEDGTVFRKAPAFSKNLQPVWDWLLFLAAVLLLFDVAARRIALEFGVVVAAVIATWDRLCGRNAAADRAPEYIDRLKARKAQVGETLGQGKKAARRFDAGDAPTAAAPPGAGEAKPAPPASPRPAPQRPKSGAEAEKEGDYLSRLKKAKKRAMEEREKEKDEE